MGIDITLIILIVFATIFIISAILYKQLSDAKDALEESHNKFQTIFDMTLESIVIYDENHNIKEVNKTTENIFGYTQAELVGKNMLQFVAPDYRHITEEKIQAKSIERYETKVIKKDGTICPILVAGRYLTINDKNVRISVIMDLTELKQTAYELETLNSSLEARVEEESNKNIEKDKKYFEQSRLAQMGEMISMIAHQWRQPLGAIASTATNIEVKMGMDKFDLTTEEGSTACKLFLHKKLQHISAYVQGLSQTIDDFRNFYNPNKKKKDTNITEPVKQALNIMKSSFASNHIKLSKKLQADKQLYIHDGEVMQVVLNILKNAQDQLLEKKIENPTIMIETYSDENASFIKISDNAGGIETKHLTKLFDPYFSTKDEKNGTGLGLYMSKVIIEEHHEGKIQASNNGEGATFTIELKSDIILK